MAHAALLTGSWDYRLVAISIIIAILAAYAALDLAGRVTATQGVARAAWQGPLRQPEPRRHGQNR